MDDMIAALMNSPVISAVLQERIRQVEQHGHAPEADAQHPPHRLADLARDYAAIARDRATPGKYEDLQSAHKKAVQAAAIAIAAAERIALEIERRRDAAANTPDAPHGEPDLFTTGE